MDTAWDLYSEHNLQDRDCHIQRNEKIWVFVVTSVLLLIISLTICIGIIKVRNIQPLRRKSPRLIIISVLGNTLCLLNVSICFSLQEMFADKENECYFEDCNFHASDYWKGNDCMKAWVDDN